MFNLDSIEIEALMLSLRVAIWSVTISLPFALAAAWVLARRNFYGKFLFDALIHLPLIVPPVVVGYLLLIGFGRNGIIGSVLFDTFGICSKYFHTLSVSHEFCGISKKFSFS